MRLLDAVIFDLDGTLIDSSARWEKHVKGKSVEEVDWNAWDADEGLDKPIPEMAAVLKAFRQSKSHQVVFLTARNETTRNYTKSQMYRWFGLHDDELFIMREEGDLRSSVEVKRDAIRALKRIGIRPVLSFEDESGNAAMMREEGLVVAHVSER